METSTRNIEDVNRIIHRNRDIDRTITRKKKRETGIKLSLKIETWKEFTKNKDVDSTIAIPKIEQIQTTETKQADLENSSSELVSHVKVVLEALSWLWSKREVKLVSWSTCMFALHAFTA